MKTADTIIHKQKIKEKMQAVILRSGGQDVWAYKVAKQFTEENPLQKSLAKFNIYAREVLDSMVADGLLEYVGEKDGYSPYKRRIYRLVNKS